jgi:hypothetical protein
MKIRLVEPAEDVPVLSIRVDGALRITGWSKPTLYRHLPFLKTYHVKMPGMTKGTLLIDYQGLKDYLNKFTVEESTLAETAR